jgi:hypothetical protein
MVHIGNSIADGGGFEGSEQVYSRFHGNPVYDCCYAFGEVPAIIRNPIIVGPELLTEQSGKCLFSAGQRVPCAKGDSPVWCAFTPWPSNAGVVELPGATSMSLLS